MFGLYEENHPDEAGSFLHEDGMPLKQDIFDPYNTKAGSFFNTFTIIGVGKPIETNFCVFREKMAQAIKMQIRRKTTIYNDK